MSNRNYAAAQSSGEPRPDLVAMQLRNELVGMLYNITDHGSSVDTGGGLGSEDIYCTVGGYSFHIKISHDVNRA